ncbi:MAG: nucleotide exchange factor GrpE [Pirellulales bacterium]|nr:nucleotide exchange factor GrpE [Pirellulales bacterium]
MNKHGESTADETTADDAAQMAEEYAAAVEPGEPESAAGDQPADESATLREELSAARDRALRLQAEMENLRTRTARELADTTRYAALPFARDLLPVLDNMERAIEAAEKDASSGNLLDGFRLVRQQLLSVLAQYQVEPIEAAGQPFDPQFHAAILQQPSDEVPANHVLLVAQGGYRLHDRVVRPAQVIVSSGKSAS